MATPDEIAAQIAEEAAQTEQRADSAIAGADAALVNVSRAVDGLRVDYYVGNFNPDDVTTNAVPAPSIPTSDFSSDVKAAFDHAFGKFNEDIKPQIIDYLAEFFPDINESIKTDSDQWILDTINGTSGMVPAEIEAATWNRARDREVQDAQRVEQSIVNSAAARGFSMPPGSMLAALQANQQDAARRLASLSREQAIKAFDIANDNVKFAVQQAIGLRVSFVGALSDFIKTAMVQPSQAADYSRTILEAKKGLYDSAVRLYSARLTEEEMRVRTLQQNRAHDLDYARIWLQGAHQAVGDEVSIAKVKADAAISQAEILGRVAAAALATRNTMLNVAAGV